MAMSMKTLSNVGKKMFTKLSPEDIVKEGISGKLMPYRFSKGMGAAIVGVSAGGAVFSEVNKSYQSSSHGHAQMAENLDRLVSIDGTGFANKVAKVSGGDKSIERDIVKNTFDNPNQFFAHNNLVFALHNRRDG